MQSSDLLKARIKELANRAYTMNYVTSTDFLSVAEQADFFASLSSLGVPKESRLVEGARYLLYGGYPEAERAMAVFLPSYLTEEEFLEQELESPSILTCIQISPRAARYADELTHRDYLGSMMQCGMERDQIGDILTDGTVAFAFVTTTCADVLVKELTRVKHTSVDAAIVPISACSLRPSFEECNISVASERLDAVLGGIYHLARGKAQELIDREAVFVDGRCVTQAGYLLKAESRISVRGFGKFIYIGPSATTKKGRLYVTVRIYR